VIRLLALVVLVAPAGTVERFAPPPMPPAKDPVYYWPAKVGTKWVTEQEKLEIRWEVSKAERTDRGLVVTNRVSPGKSTAWTEQRCLVSGEGLWGVGDPKPGEKADPIYQVLKLPHTPGQKWEVTARKNNGEYPPFETAFAFEAAESETVTVPAGTFRCIKLRSKWSFNGHAMEPFTCWYSLGVGEVKRENDRGELVSVLKSFTPAKE
jgi:hypothetical protein